MQSPKRNAVFTLAMGYGERELAPLVNSLAATSFDGDLVVFQSQLAPDGIELLRRAGAILVPFRYPKGGGIRKTGRHWHSLWRHLFAIPLPEGLETWLARRVLNHTYLRFLMYLEYLEDQPDRYANIFIADSRDVAFQADPFGGHPAPGVHVFKEDPRVKIGDCPYHRKWFNDVFGAKILQELSDKLRVCSGTTFGDVASMIPYLHAMRRQIFLSQNMNTGGGDQAIHNYLFYTDQIKNVVPHELGDGAVLTLGNASFESLKINAVGQVLNDAGEVAAVLHQYDRIPRLREQIESKYGASVTSA